MNATDFIKKWRKVRLTERSASQQHFLDLCALLEHPTPAEADPEGATFTFEKGVRKRGGGDGWADAWKKGFFGWEYKGKHKNLEAAYAQLLQYCEALDNPPLLVVCDMARIVVHTHFNNEPHTVHEIPLAKMGDPANLAILRAVFEDPERLRPGTPIDVVTERAAQHIAAIAQSLRDRGLEPHAVARFLDRIVFCLFAEDIGLLPGNLFSRILDKAGDDPQRFTKLIGQLFDAMAHGGDFGLDTIRHFNGNLFMDGPVATRLPPCGPSLDKAGALSLRADASLDKAGALSLRADGPVIELTEPEIAAVADAARLDWGEIKPSILGTLFERGLDPAKRAQLGAHYTSEDDIRTLVEPVVLGPLRREWDETRQIIDNLLTTGRKSAVGTRQSAEAIGNRKSAIGNRKPLTGAKLRKARDEAVVIVNRFLERLSRVKVLDPACGSGNFLYVTLQMLKNLEKEVVTHAADCELGGFLPRVLPTQLHGIEINPYAYELAQMTVWIGWLQWTRKNGFGWPADPVLRPMDTFECKDAILDLSDPDHPREPTWPKVDFIVGNPPFLGVRKMRKQLGDGYVDALFSLWEGRVPGGADLCCYWHEKARSHVEGGRCQRAGLLATQGIRGGANREVLDRMKSSGDIFFAESDRPWVLDGASVHVSMVAFDNGQERHRILDGRPVACIHPNLTGEVPDTTTARKLAGSLGIAFIGTTKKAPLDIDPETALPMLLAPNAHGRPNSDVIVPFVNGMDVTKRRRGMFIIDFPVEMTLEDASRYEAPFEYVVQNVKPLREGHREKVQRVYWWRLARPCPDLKRALQGIDRFCATPEVSKHRVFAWLAAPTGPDHTLIAFVRADDYFLGVVQSRPHEVWALELGTRLETRPRYTPTTCFGTFPFPEPTQEQSAAIAEAARELNALRERWLNPPEWVREEVLEFPGTVGGPWTRYIEEEGSGLRVPGARNGGGGEGSGLQVPGARNGEDSAAEARNPEPGTRNPEPETRNRLRIGTVRYPRLVPRDAACAKRLKQRTLTNLYNARPTWLDMAHRKLDAAVFAAYGWDADMTDEQILEKLLALNLARAGAAP